MTKIIVMAIIALFAVIPMLSAAREAVAAPPATPIDPMPNRAIVNGHHVQPRASTLMTPNEDIGADNARQLDELYRLQTGADPGTPTGR